MGQAPSLDGTHAHQLLDEVSADKSQHKGLKIISVTAADTFGKAFKTLAENDVLSAPVLDGDGDVLGVVDTWALVRELLLEFAQSQALSLDTGVRFDEAATVKLLRSPLSALVLSTRLDRTPFLFLDRLPAGLTVRQFITHFALNASRTLIFNTKRKDSTLVGILSQGDICRYLNKYPSLVPSSATPVGELGNDLCGGAAAQCNQSQSTIHAFLLMRLSDCTAVWIVDDSGKYLTTVTINDLLGFHPVDDSSEDATLTVVRTESFSRMQSITGGLVADFAILFSPVAEFIAQRDVLGKASPSVEDTTPLRDIIKELASSHHHHITVLKQGVPQFVLTLSDIFRYICNHS